MTCQGFPQEVDTSGGFLTIGYFSRTIGHCFLEIFVEGQGFDGGGQSGDKGIPGPPTRENPGCAWMMLNFQLHSNITALHEVSDHEMENQRKI